MVLVLLFRRCVGAERLQSCHWFKLQGMYPNSWVTCSENCLTLLPWKMLLEGVHVSAQLWVGWWLWGQTTGTGLVISPSSWTKICSCRGCVGWPSPDGRYWTATLTTALKPQTPLNLLSELEGSWLKSITPEVILLQGLEQRSGLLMLSLQQAANLLQAGWLTFWEKDHKGNNDGLLH